MIYGRVPQTGSLIRATPAQIEISGGLVVFPIEFFLKDNEWYVKETSPNFGIVLDPDTLLLVIKIYCENPIVLLCEYKGEIYSAHVRDNDWMVLQ
jgi:hypothetical protein